MKDEINTTSAWQPTPNFEDCKNYKEFFILHDSLANLESELVFSVFERYVCKAGCKVCYVKDNWIPDEEFKQFIPSDIPPETEHKIIEFFNYFQFISTVDDLYNLKKNHPKLYEFYVRHSHLMALTSMTDMAFIQQYDIILNELNFKSIYEISFSDEFLNKKDGTFVNIIIDKLNHVLHKYTIQKIKIILCGHVEDNPAVSLLIDWAKSNNIFVDLHDDITQEQNVRFDLDRADHQETNHFSEDNHVYLIHCESIFLQFTSLFLTMADIISPADTSFYNINQENIPLFIHNMIETKIQSYAQECQRMKQTDNKYFEYYKYVSTHIHTNLNYNFIPRFVLKPYSKLYQQLATEGFNNTPAGLLLTGVTVPVPLFNVTESVIKQPIPIDYNHESN